MSVNVKSTKRILEKERAKIAASRDKLRDLEDDIQGLRQDCDDALESLEYAIDVLSRLQ